MRSKGKVQIYVRIVTVFFFVIISFCQVQLVKQLDKIMLGIFKTIYKLK